MRTRAERHIVSPETGQLRDTQSGLERDEQQDAVAPADPGRGIRGGEQGGGLGGRQKRDDLPLKAAAGHGEESLTNEGMGRLV
ncbi:MAG TPA: hypothetical protein VK911_05605, partial [Vicinamibacterales bacterium]|nr:hypothetical protein [Vicinamibacterales bacterium]